MGLSGAEPFLTPQGTALNTKIGSDIGSGLFHAPAQIVGGALDAFNNISAFADKAALKLQEMGVPDGGVQLFDNDGKWAPKVLGPEELMKARQNGTWSAFHVPTTGTPDSITGNIIRTGTDFLLGRGTEGGALAAAPQVARSFFSGAVATDPNQARLSNVINQVAPNFVTDWLKADPKDEKSMLSNLKSGLEYAGMDALWGSAVKGLKWLKGIEKAEPAPGGGEAAAAQPGAGQPTVPETAGEAGQAPRPVNLTPEGDPDFAPLEDPDFVTEGNTVRRVSPSPADEMQDAFARQGAGVGDEQVEKAYALGQPDKDLVQVTPDIEAKAKAYLENKTGDNPAWVNLERIKGPDDIKEALARVATQLPQQEAQSNDQTLFLANALGLQPQDFLAGYKGQNLNASETTAMRLMLDSSATQLVDFAAAARANNAQPEAMGKFLKAFAVHSALQQYAMNARAEAGRTLQSWSIMADQGSQYTRAIQNIIANVGQQDVQKMAQQISDLNDPLLVNKYMANTTRMTGRDAILYGYNNLLLSNPRTVVKKLASDTIMAFWNTITRYAAEQSPVGMSGSIPPGEAAQLAYGYVSSLRDGIKLAGKALATGERQWLPYSTLDYQDATSRLQTMSEGAPDVLDPQKPTANFADALKVFLPTRWIGAADDFAKYVNYRAELRSLAYRSGIDKGLTQGSDDMANHISDTMENVPQDLHQQAVSAALRNTFQEPLVGAAKKLQDFMDDLNLGVPHTDLKVPVGRVLMPFIKVPFNIMKFGYRNSPLAIWGGNVPGTGLNEELAAGGATRDLALAKMSLGTMVTLSAADLALSNTITGRGPSNFDANQAWRRAGNEPYSIRIGDKWYSYNNLEPFGLMLGAVADTFNVAKFNPENRGLEDAATSLAFGMGNAFLSKTYMSGLSNFFDALQNPDADSKSYTDRLITSLTLPQGVQGFAHAFDPWRRAHYGILDQMEGNTPFMSDKLPPARTLWGDPIKREDGFLPPFSGTGLARMVSPVTVASATGAEPIDKWVWDNKEFFPQSVNGKIGLNAPGRNFSWEVPMGNGQQLRATVQLSPQQYDRLRAMAGNEFKDGGTAMGAKDTLNAIVQGKYPNAAVQGWWDRSTPAERSLFVLSTWGKFVNGARRQLMHDDPVLQASIKQALEARAQQLQSQPQ